MKDNRHALPQSALVPASDFVIIGGTGDLALRKIFPALFLRFLHGQVTKDFRLVVMARKPITRDDFAEMLAPYLGQTLKEEPQAAERLQDFLGLLHFACADISSGEGMADLAGYLLDGAAPDRPMIFYLAIASTLFSDACQTLARFGLALDQSRLVVEKPLGHDYASAEAINAQLLSVFSEAQIYRIDHYLGKETVQNLMALRFANVIFEALWNNRYIDHVQITAAETVGVEDRAAYYDQYGAIRDMLQNHLLQLLCLVAMEPPARFDADKVRNEKLRVLEALRAVEPGQISIGQYQEYEGEIGRASTTETYAAMVLHIDNWRWAGVPFYVRTGKRLRMRASEIVITFKERPHDIFSRKGFAEPAEDFPNRLIIRVQPQEGLRLLLTSKAPGPGGMRLLPSELNLSFGETFNQRLPDAYERLLMDVARGNQTLFMRLDEVLAAWAFIDPVLAMTGAKPPQLYRSGTMGPEDKLFAASGRAWIDPKEAP